MRIFLIVCLCSLVCLGRVSARQLELAFPGLTHRVKVFLPENHEPGKKYPTLFYYHGAGGKPDTSLMRHYTRDQDWIVVGMAYYQLGSVTFDSDSLAEQKHLLGSVQNHLTLKYGLDAKRCYVAGFSKGGWLSDMLIQLDSDLAGAVILGAGHLDQVKKTPKRYRKNTPVFIGVGRKDPNYPFALQAVMFHRGLGAATSFEVWPELGHTLPPDGSHALYQWLAMRAKSPASLRGTAKKEMHDALATALKLPPLDQWDRLRQLRDLPYAQLLGKEWKVKVDRYLSTLEEKDLIKKESIVLEAHRKLIRKEVKKNSLENIVHVQPAYLALSDKYPNTRQGKIARHDYERTTKRLHSFSEHKKKNPTKKPQDPDQPKKVDLPTNRRRIPKNPLIR